MTRRCPHGATTSGRIAGSLTGMELIAAVLLAGPLGYLVTGRTRAHGLAIYLVLWAVIFPFQTIVIHAENPDEIGPSYFVVNAVILAGGIALNSLGARLRARRATRRRSPSGKATSGSADRYTDRGHTPVTDGWT